MTTSTASRGATAEGVVGTHHTRTAPFARRAPVAIPLLRLTTVELRKMFDTRSGLWLLAGLAPAAVLTSGAIIAWAPAEQLTSSPGPPGRSSATASSPWRSACP